VEREHAALLALLAELKRRAYHFVASTPATHERVVARRRLARAGDLRDVFGWSRPFAPGALDSDLLALLADAGLIERLDGGLQRSQVRVSSLGQDLYVHTAFPTQAEDAVFFGPDSYRFARLIAAELERLPAPARVLDIGTGSGVGAIVAGRAYPGARLVGTDINPRALRFAAVNAEAAGFAIDLVEAETLDPLPGSFELILANPPYMIDGSSREYRDGGAMHGGGVTLEMTRAALPRLATGGRLLLYTGSAIIEGEDRLRAALADCAAAARASLDYREIDPDVFGEELAKPAYAQVERIAVVRAVFTAPSAN
jgi:methylase of polypeptide subunit release factors